MHTCKDCQQTCVWDSMSLYYMQLISKPCTAVKSFEFSLSTFSATKKIPLKKPSALFKGSVSRNFIGTPVGWKCFIKSMAMKTCNNYSKIFFYKNFVYTLNSCFVIYRSDWGWKRIKPWKNYPTFSSLGAIYSFNPQNEALPRKVHLILSFWIIRNVIAF